LIYYLLEHIRRAEGISLFPLPPHLSPASSFFRLIESFVPRGEMDTPQDEFDVSMACEGLFTVANLATQDLFLIFCGDSNLALFDLEVEIVDEKG
jgi:hypothetical protein